MSTPPPAPHNPDTDSSTTIPHSPPSTLSSPVAKRPKMSAPFTDNIPQPSVDKPLPTVPPPNNPVTTDLAVDAATLSKTSALQVKLLSEHAKAPTRGSAFAAGYDMYAAEGCVIPARGQAMVDTGLSVAVPVGTYGRVAPRSGLAAKHGLHTGAGVIDADYRGQVFVLLFNLSDKDFTVERHDRVAQLVLERIVNPDVVVVEQLAETVRGTAGFGSTGGFAGNGNAQ